VKLRQLDLFDPIRKQMRIAQKTVKHTPTDKVRHVFHVSGFLVLDAPCHIV
jgi:hypothetical protein